MEIPWISIPLKLFHIDTQKWPIFEKPEKTTFSKFPSFLGYPAVSFRENVLQNDAIIWKRDTFSRTFDDSIMGDRAQEAFLPNYFGGARTPNWITHIFSIPSGFVYLLSISGGVFQVFYIGIQLLLPDV